MSFLNKLLSSEVQDYIKRCHKIYVRFILEAKLQENDKIKQERCGI